MKLKQKEIEEGVGQRRSEEGVIRKDMRTSCVNKNMIRDKEGWRERVRVCDPNYVG